MSFPTIVYKCPGNHKCQGSTYDYKAAQDKQQFYELVKAGWAPSLQEAIESVPSTIVGGTAKHAASASTAHPVSDSEVIRAWLSVKLNDGGIDHDESMSEDELLFLFCSEFTVGEPPAEDEPPTREELEAKAEELGIKFDGRTTDAGLLRRIAAELDPGAEQELE